jgi:hypothetical protein
VTGSSSVMADKKRGQCAFGQDAQAQKYRVNLSCGKSCSESTSIGKKGRNFFTIVYYLSNHFKDTSLIISMI